MIPIRDRLPSRTTPFVTYALVAINVLVFLWQGAIEEAGYANVVSDFGLVPGRLLQQPALEVDNVMTSMFMHGGWGHLFGNMLFLWIFGDNVEDAIGHLRYIGFYLLSGIGAASAQIAVDPSSMVPMVGASGAIAGVLAAYLSLYPRSPVTVLNPVPLMWFFWGLFIELPAWVLVLEWFVVNLFGGFGALAAARDGGGGVAFFAHIGGFVAGLFLIRAFMRGRSRRQADRWSGWRPPPSKRPREYDPWGRRY